MSRATPNNLIGKEGSHLDYFKTFHAILQSSDQYFMSGDHFIISVQQKATLKIVELAWRTVRRKGVP